MQCIFCKRSSDRAKSVEHIVPQSLGNTRHILPRGSICDTCNNYFARKLENPILSHRSFRNLRASNGIPSKRGKIPWLLATHLNSGFEVAITQENGEVQLKAEKGKTADQIWEHLQQNEKDGLHGFAVNFEINPPQREMSRLLAKMALERCFSDLIIAKKRAIEMIFDSYFDNIRRWARLGDNFSSWPYHQKRIHPQESQMRDPKTNQWVKAGIGQGLFHTPTPETYYSITIYGIEFVINVGGPNIDGLNEWLLRNNQASPYFAFSGVRLSIDGDGVPRLERGIPYNVTY